jgi:hypothetical protein
LSTSCFDAGLDETDLGEDIAAGGGPDERLSMSGSGLRVGQDLGDERVDPRGTRRVGSWRVMIPNQISI